MAERPRARRVKAAVAVRPLDFAEAPPPPPPEEPAPPPVPRAIVAAELDRSMLAREERWRRWVEERRRHESRASATGGADGGQPAGDQG